MKNNEEFRASVFEKALRYKEKKKQKTRERKRLLLALLLIVLMAVPAVYIPLSQMPGNQATAAGVQTTGGTFGTVQTEAATNPTGATTEIATKSPEASAQTTAAQTTAVQTTAAHTAGTKGTTTASGIKEEFVTCYGFIALGKASGKAPHKVILSGREEALTYTSHENMRLFIDDFLRGKSEEYFSEYVIIGYYFECEGGKRPVIEEFIGSASGDRIYKISLKESENAEGGACFIITGASKTWLDKGGKVTFLLEE